MKTNRGVLWRLVHVLTVLSLVVALVPASVGAAGLAPASPPAQATPPKLPPSAGWSPLNWQQFVALSQSAHDRLAVPAGDAPFAEASDASTVSPMAVQQAAPGVMGARRFDQPSDQVGIQIGINLWNTYRLAVKPEDIVWAIQAAPGLDRRPAQREQP
jgi:hypothetical protein